MNGLVVGLVVVLLAFVVPLLVILWLKWLEWLWDWLCGYH